MSKGHYSATQIQDMDAWTIANLIAVKRGCRELVQAGFFAKQWAAVFESTACICDLILEDEGGKDANDADR